MFKKRIVRIAGTLGAAIVLFLFVWAVSGWRGTATTKAVKATNQAVTRLDSRLTARTDALAAKTDSLDGNVRVITGDIYGYYSVDSTGETTYVAGLTNKVAFHDTLFRQIDSVQTLQNQRLDTLTIRLDSIVPIVAKHTAQIGTIEGAVDRFNSDLANMGLRVGGAETRIGKVANEVDRFNAQVVASNSRISGLEARPPQQIVASAPTPRTVQPETIYARQTEAPRTQEQTQVQPRRDPPLSIFASKTTIRVRVGGAGLKGWEGTIKAGETRTFKVLTNMEYQIEVFREKTWEHAASVILTEGDTQGRVITLE